MVRRILVSATAVAAGGYLYLKGAQWDQVRTWALLLPFASAACIAWLWE